MAKVSITIFSCLIFIACQQADNNRNPFPNEIRNSKLATHINIPGTRVFLVPPEGFKISSKFKGIEKDDFTRIEVIDVKGENFYRTTPTFSKDKIEQAGYDVLEYKDLTVNGLPAKMVFVRWRGSTKLYSLVFGDSTFTTTIMASFNSRDRATGEQVQQALVSVYYDTSKKVNLYAPAIFTLDDSKSIFKYAKSEAGKNIYSLRGVKEQYKTEPYVVAVNVPIAELTMAKVADKLALIPGNYNIGNINESTINGFPSLTREVIGELEGREVIIFQHLVLIEETVVCMQGVAGSDDFETYLEEFKKLTNTVSKKTKKPLKVRPQR